MASHVLPVGTILKDRYKIIRQLGEGGMGVVYEAFDKTLARSVAVKVLNPALARKKTTVSRFENEAKAIAQIKSEHIVEVHDTGRVDKSISALREAPFMVMEMLNGRDLADLLAKKHALPPQEAVGYVLEALLALAQAHAQGIVHRDLKPANLFLAKQPDGRKIVKVLDFGISKLSSDIGGHRLTSDSQVLGSPAYMAPEQLRHSNQVDVRADIWSLGVILYELMTGRLPFDGATTGALFAAIIERPPVPMQRYVAEFPQDLERVVLRCLAKQPEARWSDVVELSDALMPFGPPSAQESAARIKRLASQPGLLTEECTTPSMVSPVDLIRNPTTDRTMMVDSDDDGASASEPPEAIESLVPAGLGKRKPKMVPFSYVMLAAGLIAVAAATGVGFVKIAPQLVSSPPAASVAAASAPPPTLEDVKPVIPVAPSATVAASAEPTSSAGASAAAIVVAGKPTSAPANTAPRNVIKIAPPKPTATSGGFVADRERK